MMEGLVPFRANGEGGAESDPSLWRVVPLSPIILPPAVL